MDGEYYIAVKYNCANARDFNLIVNGTDYGKINCPGNGSWYGNWTYQIAKVTLKKGTNTVSISNTTLTAAVISEIVVYNESEWHVPSDVDSFEGGSIVVLDALNSFNSEHIDFGQKGAVAWDIEVPTGGIYKLVVAYSTGATWGAPLNAYADGTKVGNWIVSATGSAYGDSFGFLETSEFYLLEGVHSIKVEATMGGTFVDSIRLELVKEYSVPSTEEDVYSSHDAVYPDGFKAGTSSTGVEYVDFNNKSGSIVFTVNAPRAGEYYIAVGYNTANERRFEMFVNGTSYGDFICPANGTWYGGWSYQIVKVNLKAGANTVSIAKYFSYDPVIISELRVSPVYEWLLPSDANSLAGGAVVQPDTYYSFNGEHFDFGQNGSATWKVTVPANGSYRLVFTYSTGATWGAPIKAYADGKLVKQWTVTATGGYGLASGFLTSDEFYLSAGEHTVTYEAPLGGAFGDAVRLQLVNACDEHVYNGDAICDNCGYACTHTGGKATCISGAVCNVCKTEYTEKDPTNHASNELTYTVIDGVTHKVAHKCCGTKAPDGDCEYGSDNICDKCGYDGTVIVETNDLNNAISNIVNGTSNNVTVVGPTGTMADDYIVEKIEGVAYEYKYFNIAFDDEDNFFLRHHFVSEGALTVTVNGTPVELKSESANVYYFDVYPVAGQYHVADEISVNGDVYYVSLYSYIKLALETDGLELTNDQVTLLKALYDLNEALR